MFIPNSCTARNSDELPSPRQSLVKNVQYVNFVFTQSKLESSIVKIISNIQLKKNTEVAHTATAVEQPSSHPEKNCSFKGLK